MGLHIYWSLGLGLVLFSTYFYFNRSQRRLPLPPGPKGSYINGIQDQLPSAEPWKKYAEWSRCFSSTIISFRVYNQRIVVLNDHKVVRALLDQRAHLYSDRPYSWMYNNICQRGDAVFNISSLDPRHRLYRRLLQSGLGPRATKATWPTIKEQTNILLNGFSAEPQRWQEHVGRHAAAVVMKLAFGYTIDSLEDSFIKIADESSKISGWATAPGSWFVNYYPILRFVPAFFPCAGWKRQGLVWRELLKNLSDVPHKWVKQQMSKGVFEESFTSRLLNPEDTQESRPITAQEEDAIKWCADGLYAGAADTTVSAITSFILLMTLHPKIQAKAQLEIDSMLDTYDFSSISEIPDPSEVARLPYITAVMKEVLRFAPVANQALPHRVVEEDEIEGHRIPKGSTVIANVWAIMHDSELYRDPFSFDPERFIGDTDTDKAPEIDPRQFAFGFGRRVCPGSHFAETSMFLVMASILARFSIKLDEREQTAPIAPEFTTGITSHIKSFPIQITPRVSVSQA